MINAINSVTVASVAMKVHVRQLATSLQHNSYNSRSYANIGKVSWMLIFIRIVCEACWLMIIHDYIQKFDLLKQKEPLILSPRLEMINISAYPLLSAYILSFRLPL